jgi:zinc transport system substrate-binding protein
LTAQCRKLRGFHFGKLPKMEIKTPKNLPGSIPCASNIFDRLTKAFENIRSALPGLGTQSLRILALLLIATTATRADGPKVVASFKPIHSLVASVMQGIGEPYLLVKGAASPRSYSLTASDATALQESTIVFWVGRRTEPFLRDALKSLGGGTKVVTLNNVDGLTLHYQRRGLFGEFDPHIWLEPENAGTMLREIGKTLSYIDPANAAAYEANVNKTVSELGALARELETTLAPVKSKPFITFHDGIQYFEKRFEVEAARSYTVDPEVPPSAERVAALRAKAKDLKAVCLFTEPDFDRKILDLITQGTTAKIATLDPEASGIAEGPDLYAQSLREIAGSMAACLEAGN